MKYRQQGFILPVVIILSIGLSIVGVTAFRTVSNSSVTLNNQYYNQLAREAAQAAASKAASCVKQGIITWANPLKPNTDCTGTAGSGLTYVSKDTNWKSTFEVPTPTTVGTKTTITALGTVTLTMADGTSIGQTVTKNIRMLATTTPATFSPAESDGSASDHTCMVASGKVYCWGYNSLGRLGDGTTTNSAVPVAVDTSGVLAGKTAETVAAGSRHTCAVADGQAYCWGYGSNGRLGNNSTTNSLVPVAVDTSGVLAGKTITSMSAGADHTCAVADGKAYCWGYNSLGRLGDGTTTTSTVPVAVSTSGVLAGKTVTDISAGYQHTCAVASGQAYCWGYNSNGRLGNGLTTNSPVPVAVNTSGVLAGKTVTSISAGNEHTCAVADGKAYCWGYGSLGRLGNGSTATSLVPVAVVDTGVLAGKTITHISAGAGATDGGEAQHTCVAASGKAYCWGYNSLGRLGDGTTTNSSVPVAVNTSGVMAGKTVTSVTTGYRHTCAVASGQAFCWGYNSLGRLGDGTATNSLVPVAVNISGVLAGKTVTDGYAEADPIYDILLY